jgi:hypothetical protein
LYVAANGTGGGTSWADAYTNIQTGINNAGNNDNIYIAQGTYSTTGALEWCNSSGITIQGGFAATNGSPGTNNPDLYPTVITRDIASEHRIFLITNVTDITLNKVQITGGDNNGGGLFFKQCCKCKHKLLYYY